MIRQKRVQRLGAHVRNFNPGDRVVAALRVDEGSRNRLVDAGFVEPITVGQTILPASHIGRIATLNAEGSERIHDDQPQETIYRAIEWTHEQWNGPDTETVTTIVERPYRRYPRSFIAPPSVELSVKRSNDGAIFICAPERILGENDELLIHDINLVLEIIGECELLTPGLLTPLRGNLLRLNWDVLPRGHYPWATLQELVRPKIERLAHTAKPVIEHRLEVVSRYPHEFVAIGRAGFAGYVVFGFPTLGIYVLECTHEGNATYIFGNDWEQLSQMSKAEVLSDGRHLHRLIHTRNWRQHLAELMRAHGY